jgi:hypothetical protein
MPTFAEKPLLMSRLLTLAALLTLPLCLMAQKGASNKDKAALQKMYIDFLKEEGYQPSVDDDGDVVFKSEGKTLFINVLEDDPAYFRLVLANIWPIESENERGQVYIATDFSNAKAKVTKSYVVRDNVWVGIELFLPKPEDFKGVFKRSMSALNNGVAQFVSKMREQQGTD